MAHQTEASSTGLDSTLHAVLGHDHHLERRTDSSLGTVPAVPVATENGHTLQTGAEQPGLPGPAPTKRQEVPLWGWRLLRGTGTMVWTGLQGGALRPTCSCTAGSPRGSRAASRGCPALAQNPASQTSAPQGHCQVTILKVMTSKYQSETHQQSLGSRSREFRADALRGQAVGPTCPGTRGPAASAH